MRNCWVMILLVLPATGLSAPAFAAPLVDPMRPATWQVSPAPPPVAEGGAESLRNNLQLSAILIAPERSVAVINGQALQVGQLLHGYRLTDIGANQVSLQNGKDHLILYRTTTHLKKPPVQGLADSRTGSLREETE